MHYDHARHRAEAEALFKKKEDASLEGSRAREVYQANEGAMREKTALASLTIGTRPSQEARLTRKGP
jgi:hypothetical protein